MKIIFTKLIALVSILLWNEGFTQTTRIYPDNPNIQYTGRIDFSNPKKPTFHYSGVTIRAKFEGIIINLLMKGGDESYLNVSIDNALPTVLKLNNTDTLYTIAKDLSEGPHTIEIVRRAETFYGVNDFLGFQLEVGKSLLPMARPTRRMEFIGNSITCGYGIEASGPTDPFGPATENVGVAFGSVTAKNFSAEQLTVCRSGIGIYRNGGNTPGPSADAMPAIYDRVFIYSNDPKWDFTNYTPQVVVVDLGTNDFSGAGADSALFVQAYESFLKTIRENYPSAKIFAVVGPMMGGEELTRIKAYLTAMVARFNNAGDNDVFFFELSGQGCCGFGSDYHPSVRQAERNARELTKFIESKIDWKARPEVLSAKLTTDGKAIEVAFDKNMGDPSSDTTSFKVQLNTGSIVKIKSATIIPTDNKKVLLNLSTPVTRQDVVNLSYVEGALKSEDKEALGTFAPRRVTNNVVSSLVSQSLNFQIFVVNADQSLKKIIITGITESKAEINLFNIQGVRIGSIFRGSLVRGKNEIIIDDKSMNLASGLYLVRAELNGEVLCQKVYID